MGGKGMLEFSVLGSGSSGNCALVRSEETALLLDAGLSARQIDRRLAMLGVDAASLDGILITHEHGDHTRGIDVFSRNRGACMPVYCTAMTREVIRDSIRAEIDWRLFESGQEFSLGNLKVQSFPVPHDAVDPLGFLIRNGAAAMGVLSDIGHVTNLVRTHLREAHALFLEANYDEVLLRNDTKRPWPTKQRIQSRHGHLSNDQAAELAAEVATENLSRIVLGHLSQDCNDPGLARDLVSKRLREKGFEDIAVCCATQGEPTEWFPVVARAVESVEMVETGVVREKALALEQEFLL